MSTKLKKKLEKILQLLDRLAAESAVGVPIIVEGGKDIDALHELGIEGEIIPTKSGGKSFLDTLRELEEKRKPQVILFLDFDRRGKEWSNRLSQHLEKMRINPNLLFWKELHSLVGHDVKDIEGLTTYLETLEKKIGFKSRKV